MNLTLFDYYLIVVNIVGFLAFAINTYLYRNTPNGQIDRVLNFVMYFGGTIGLILGILIFREKDVTSDERKSTMMSRVSVSCFFVVDVIIYLVVKDVMLSKEKVFITNFYIKYRIILISLLIYLLFVNVITYLAFGEDKRRAIKGESRIRITTLLILAFAGGSIGGLIAMNHFRHKTSKDYFAVGLPLMLIMQVVVIGYVLARMASLI